MRPRRFFLRVIPPFEPVRLLASRLIIVDDSILDDQEILRLHTFVVVTNRSVDAKVRYSVTNSSPEFKKRMALSFSASAFASIRRSARCSIGIVNGSILKELFHVAFGYDCTGESCTGWSRGMRFAFAMA